MALCCSVCLSCDVDLDCEYHCYDCFVVVCLDCSVDFDCEEDEWLDVSGDVIMADSCCV